MRIAPWSIAGLLALAAVGSSVDSAGDSAGAAQAAEPADLVLHSGVVHTLEASRPRAQAVAARDGAIVFVGSTAEARLLIGPKTRVVDLGGRPLYPGFIDAHGHLANFARTLLQVDLVGSRSYGDVIDRVRAEAAALPPGTWIEGRGWDQNDWPEKAFPNHRALSAAVSEHPVVLTRVDGHALLVNAAAMRAAGVGRDARFPGEGGRILLDADGEPTGVFVDSAMSLVRRHVPPTSQADLRRGVQRAIAELHEHGVTAIHDAGVGTETIRLYEEMAADGEFDLRNYVMVRGDPGTLGEWLPPGPVEDLGGHGRITVRSIKLSADGALGSRGAALLEDYDDEPGNRGLEVTSGAYVQEVAVRALGSGFQLCVHAIGDRANRFVLDAFEAALEAQPRVDHRFRVEHAQILSPRDVPRFAELGVIPSMQAQHQTSDMDWALERVGAERAKGAYAWRWLLDTGVIVAGGSDFPVEVPDPIAAYHAAVARQDSADRPEGGWYPEQRMSRGEALAHLTVWPAFAGFAEDRLGSIRPGKRADLVVLSRDLVSCPFEEIEGVRVDLTIFDGRVVYEH